MRESVGSRSEQGDPRGEHRDRSERSGTDDDHATSELVLLDPRKVQGDAAPGTRGVQRAFVRLDPADSRALTRGQDLDLIADDEATLDERAGDHRAEAGQREGPVDRKTREA